RAFWPARRLPLLAPHDPAEPPGRLPALPVARLTRGARRRCRAAPGGTRRPPERTRIAVGPRTRRARRPPADGTAGAGIHALHMAGVSLPGRRCQVCRRRGGGTRHVRQRGARRQVTGVAALPRGGKRATRLTLPPLPLFPLFPERIGRARHFCLRGGRE